jgi:hypothetical protein
MAIGTFYREYGVADFYASYGEHEVSIEVLETGEVHSEFPAPSTTAGA